MAASGDALLYDSTSGDEDDTVTGALVGEAVLSALNSSLDTWDQSAGGTLIERRLIDWTAARIGLGAAADGGFGAGMGAIAGRREVVGRRRLGCQIVRYRANTIGRAWQRLEEP